MQVNNKLEEVYFNVSKAMKSRKDQSLLKIFYDEVKKTLGIYDMLLASLKPKEEEPEVNEESAIAEAIPEETIIEE